jgi:phosphatidylinositol-3-phosphatase
MSLHRLRHAARLVALLGICTILAACNGGSASPVPPPVLTTAPIKHVFTIILENQAYNNTFGPQMPVPYLSQTVAAQGASVPNYYGTSHFSLGNYLSLVSGQAVTTANQDDCTNLAPGVGSNYVNINVTGMAAFSQVAGIGCIYPASTLTVADQLSAAGLTWKGYMEDMGNDTTREQAKCGQPGGGIGAPDNTANAQVPPGFANGGTQHVTDQYAARHNPFVYFHSVLDSGACASHVVPLNDGTLPADLASVSTTPNYVFITPNLCNDGHDVPCKTPGSPSTYVNENAFLQKWIPMIVHSPAFQTDGLLIITFDESSPSPSPQDGSFTVFDGTACCNEPSGPNTQLPGVPDAAAVFGIAITGGVGNSGGGQTGTILVSPFIKPGTVTMTAYNHYNMLHSIENFFGLSFLGYAGSPGTASFGADVFGPTINHYSINL